ncbi:UNVERIFIED_CONTAM: hypothetical protein ABID98_004324 [Brevibacillus sp. OAP136]
MKTIHNKWLIATVAFTTLFAPTGIALPAKAAGESILTPATSDTFSDLQGVAPDRKAAISRAVQLGLIQGAPNGHFRPTDKLTRQELAVLLVQALKLPLAEESTHYSDVNPKGWGSRYIEAVRVAGVMQGNGNGTFRPNAPVTREELAVLLIRASQQPLSSQTDSMPATDWGSVASWAQSYVRTALNTGSMKASDGRFLPHKAVAREEIAEMMLSTLFPTDRPATLIRVEGEQAWINGVAYRLTDRVKGILNRTNAKALQGAQLKFDAQDRTITRITSLKLQASGTVNASGEAEFSRNLVLDGQGATLDGDLVLAGDYLSVQNLSVSGEFLIGPELENDFYSYHLNVEGKTKVRGGSDNTVVFDSTSLSTVEVNKTDVHVEATNSTVIQNMVVSLNASIVSGPSATLQKVTIDNGANNVNLQGSVQQVVVTGNQEVTLTGSAKIGTVTINSSAPVNLNSTGQVGQLQVMNPSATVQVAAQGLNVSNVTLGEGVSAGAVSGRGATSASSSGEDRSTGDRPPVNMAPVLTTPIPNRTFAQGGNSVTLDLNQHFTDAEQSTLTYTVISTNLNIATVVTNGNLVTLTPRNSGTTTIAVKASDGKLQATTSFKVTVNQAVNQPPVVVDAPTAQFLTVGAGDYKLDVSSVFSDSDRDSLTFTAASDHPAQATAMLTGSVLTVHPLASGTAKIELKANDGRGGEAVTSFDVTVNEPPIVDALPAQTLQVGSAAKTFDLMPYLHDAEKDVLTVTAVSADPSVVTAGINGHQLTLAPGAVGQTNVIVTVSDGHGGTTTATLRVSVDTAANRNPVVDHAPTAQSLTVGAGDYKLDLSTVFSDPDRDTLTFTVTSDHPAQATATFNGSILTVQPRSSGTAKIELKAKDGRGGEAVASFAVTVNEPPTVDTLPAQTLQVGSAVKKLDLAPYLHDTENDTLTVTAVSANRNLVTTGINAYQLTLTPVAVGETDVTLTVTDGHGGTTTATLQVTVETAANRNPVVDHAPTAQSLTVGAGDYKLDLSTVFSDPDSDTLTFTATSDHPPQATATLNGSTLTVQPLSSGTATIEMKADDGKGGGGVTSFDVTVNEPPTLDTLPAKTLQIGSEGETLDLAPYLHDTENDTLTVTAVSADSSIVTTGINGLQLTLTPGAEGQTDVTLTVSDGRGGTTTANLRVTVGIAANRNPVVDHAPTAQSLTVGADDYTLDLSMVFSDPDSDALTFTATSDQPVQATATLNGSTLTVQPLTSGTAKIELKADDGRGGEVETSFDVTVNEPPTVDTLPAQTLQVGSEGKMIDLTPYLHDTENDTLTVTAVSADSFVVTVGINGHELALTPGAEGQTDVTLTLSDGRGGTATATMHVNVKAASSNQEPTVDASIYEQVLTEGVSNARTFDLSQLFSDPDGDTLTYEITSAPSQNVDASISGDELTLQPGVEAGTTTVTITAQDGNGGEASYSFNVRTAPLVENGNITIQTKKGVSQISIDLSTLFPNQNSFTVYQGTPDSTFTGPVDLKGKIWTGDPSDPFYTWIIGADGSAVVLHVVQKRQGGAEMFFSQYVDMGDGRIALELFDQGDGNPGHKSTGYSIEVNQYSKKTKSTRVLTRNLFDNFPNTPYIFINSIFYDFFDVMPATYFNDEVDLYGVSDYVTTSIVLKKDGRIVDVLGDLDSNEMFMPDGGTIIRKRGIYTGSQSMSLYGEWDIYPKGTIQYFGNHKI